MHGMLACGAGARVKCIYARGCGAIGVLTAVSAFMHGMLACGVGDRVECMDARMQVY